jgi:hypothetical protein
MPILGIHHVPSLTREKYEEVVRRLTNGKSRLESASDVGVEGLLVHAAGQGEDGFWIGRRMGVSGGGRPLQGIDRTDSAGSRDRRANENLSRAHVCFGSEPA